MKFSPQLAGYVLDQGTQTKVLLNLLKRVSLSGLDDLPPLDRCLSWLCLSKTLPLDTTKWDSTINNCLDSYIKYTEFLGVSDFLLDSFQIPDPQMRQLFKEIHTDVMRTAHHIKFLPYPNGEKNDSNIFDVFSQHIKRAERILFVFASLNAEMGYMQGFNELIIPVFYVFLSAVSDFQFNWNIAEALSFYLFQAMVTATSLHALYSTSDVHQISINKIEQFSQILKKINSSCLGQN